MATKIILKKSTTGGSIPLSGDLDIGELAVNLADRKIYAKNGSGTVFTLSGAYVDTAAPGSPQEGDIWYDTTNNLLKTYNGSAWASAGYQTLGALEDVTINAIASGEILKWNGSTWVNNTLAEAGIAPTSHTHTASQITDFNEAAQDAVGGIISGSGIVSVTYNDTANTIVVSASESDTLATVTGRGATTGTAISITNATSSTSTTTGALKVTGGVGIAENLNVGGNTIITGNLTVNGTTTTVNSNTVNIGDNIIVLNADETGTPSQNAGFEVERGTAANVAFIWDESTDAWDFGSYPVQNVVINGGSY